jgi:hypothetical protein
MDGLGKDASGKKFLFLLSLASLNLKGGVSGFASHDCLIAS